MFPNQHVLGYVMGPYGPVAVHANGMHGRRYGRRRMHGVGYSPGRPHDPYSLGQTMAPQFDPALQAAIAPAMVAPQMFGPQNCYQPCPPPGPAVDYSGLCPTPPGYTPAISVPQAPWRGTMLAPGLNAPQEGKVPLGIRQVTTNIFTVASSVGRLNFTARPQKPYRPTRLLVSVAHNPDPAIPGGPTTQAFLVGKVYVGTDPQQGSLDDLTLETIGAPTAFGTGQVMIQAEPGVDFTIDVGLSNPLVVPNETVVVRLDFMGDWVS